MPYFKRSHLLQTIAFWRYPFQVLVLEMYIMDTNKWLGGGVVSTLFCPGDELQDSRRFHDDETDVSKEHTHKHNTLRTVKSKKSQWIYSCFFVVWFFGRDEVLPRLYLWTCKKCACVCVCMCMCVCFFWRSHGESLDIFRNFHGGDVLLEASGECWTWMMMQGW